MLTASDTACALEFADNIENTKNDTLYITFLQPRDNRILKVLSFIFLLFLMSKSTSQINKCQELGVAKPLQLNNWGQSPFAHAKVSDYRITSHVTKGDLPQLFKKKWTEKPQPTCF